MLRTLDEDEICSSFEVASCYIAEKKIIYSKCNSSPIMQNAQPSNSSHMQISTKPSDHVKIIITSTKEITA